MKTITFMENESATSIAICQHSHILVIGLLHSVVLYSLVNFSVIDTIPLPPIAGGVYFSKEIP